MGANEDTIILMDGKWISTVELMNRHAGIEIHIYARMQVKILQSMGWIQDQRESGLQPITILIKKTPEWVEEELSKNNLFIKDIFYAFYKNNKIFIIKKTDVN